MSDGEIGSEYVINTVDELALINYNLQSNFVLGANLDLTGIDFNPLGLVENSLNPFNGSLNGNFETISSEGTKLIHSYSITMNINKYLVSTEQGAVYGLFGILGENAKLSNLKLNVVFVNNIINTSANKGTKVGALAGVNNGTISNVLVRINANASDKIEFNGITQGDQVDFGGIVGLNNETIENSRVECVDKLYLLSTRSIKHNIGLVAGTNAGTISGSYVGKESLNNYIYDVIANVSVKHTNTTQQTAPTAYDIGSVAGTNTGTIKNLLVGGTINLTEDVSANVSGYLGGIVGASNSGTIETVTALSLNVISATANADVAGIAGSTDGATINNVKFISVATNFGSFTSYGLINGKNNVAGVVANSNNGSIAYVSVESFLDYVVYEGTTDKTKFYTIKDEDSLGVTAGLVANISGTTTVNKSFVNAKISSAGNVVLTSAINETNTYFIGEVVKNASSTITNNTTYSIVDGVIKVGTGEKSITWFEIMDEHSVSETNDDWTNIYTHNGVAYVKAKTYDTNATYYKLNIENWEKFITENGFPTGEDWELQENYNVVNINGIYLYFPYLLRSYVVATENKKEPLMIVAPQSISADINEDYVTDISSVHVKEFDLDEYADKISEAIIVNYFNGAGDEGNAHNIISYKDKDGKPVEGLLNVDILPSDAQGLYMYEIIGTGRNYAYINNKKEIVFTGVSGSTPILVRIYSGFNPEIEVYVAIYTQSLLTTFKLNSNSIYYVGNEDYTYEINAFSGQSNIILSTDAENRHNGNNYATIFNVYNLSQDLRVGYTVTDKDGKLLKQTVENEEDKLSKLEIDTAIYSNITLKIKDDETIEEKYYEIVTFTLYLSNSYFDNGEIDPIKADVPIAQVSLKVNLFNSAKTIQVNGEDEEKTTHDDISFDVYLTTDFVDKTENVVIEKLEVDDKGDICLVDSASHDSIKISLNVTEGNEEIARLKTDINATKKEEKDFLNHFAELFIDGSTIVRSLYTVQEGENEKVLGYIYNVSLELKNEHLYRYIVNNVRFNIVVTATSNPNVNNANDAIEILLKPTVLSTARIENYAVQTLNVNTDYSDIVTSEHVQTSILEPGSLGNVMLIYLEPSYSEVKNVTIKTSELYVPSLNKTVKMKFTQLVLDQRKGTNGYYTTLYGVDVPVQNEDTLELKRISTIDSEGNRIYTGVICVYIQLEAFSGLEATMTIDLDVETSAGKFVTRTKELLTTYLPGTDVIYDNEKLVNNGYLIEKGTSNNQVQIKVFGYEFNENPTVTFAWNLLPKYDVSGNIEYDGIYTKFAGDYTYAIDEIQDNADGTQTVIYNRQIIYIDANNNKKIDDDEVTSKRLIGNYISYTWLKNYDEILYNAVDNSYTLTLKLNVSEDIMASFTLGATLQLTTKDGQLKTSDAEENKITFYPTDYILNSVYVDRLSNGRKNVAINKTSALDLKFTTDNENKDLTDDIYNKLLTYAKTYADNNSVNVKTKIASMFSFFKNGTITFADEELHPEFVFNLVNNEKITLLGVSKFDNLVTFQVWYGYSDKDGDGVYELNFGEHGDDDITIPLMCSFNLNVYAVNQENEIPIYSAEEIYNSTSGTWDLVEGVNYVLMNDIVLENVVPITTKIAKFDGNNRVISIKSFKVDQDSTEYGLFANIGTYEVEDQETDGTIVKQTILRNVIVDYSQFEGTLALNNSEASSITFGGLVANNNGGIIYNCDVVNLNSSTDARIDVLVGANVNVKFGGLVGVNSGVITNSRVGRDEYTKIIATATTESISTKRLGGLTFELYNSKNENDTKMNQFSIVAGGFVGENSGTISTSYVTSTNLINYSTNETTNMTAGFVGSNSGDISFSYAKADNSTITNLNPYATGYVIENKGNGIVSGFVYNNSGTITNSYSNIELQTKSAYIAGFVYNNNNSGVISESYAATTMNSGDKDNNAEQPFVGVDNAGNLLSNGTLENTYYLMRSATDVPYNQGEKDTAQALNEENFQENSNLVGFAFVLSNVKAEREQGIWSYYTLDNKKRILPELMNANVVAHSYRYVVDDEALEKVLVSARSYIEGTANNPYTISSVDEFNKVFAENGGKTQNGYVRFINHINFNDEETAIQTRTNYVLGSDTSSVQTSVEGNALTISGIYLDVDDVNINSIGLFAEVKNSYIKNLNLEFATPTTNGQFSTTTAVYSGGLAGKATDAVMINIKLKGSSTTLTGSNFVGGLAGLVAGKSLVYGIETNLNVKASSTETYLYYSEKDYQDLNIQRKTNLTYSNYLSKLSYAGGIAGVLDLTARTNINFNVQFIDVLGSEMGAKTFEGQKEANILAEYVGGVAGYASRETNSFKLRYFTGTDELLRGDTAVGGLYGVCLGDITASQVTALEETQYEYDTEMGKYIIALAENTLKAEGEKTAPTLNTEEIGNIKLLQGYKYVGGLVGVGLNSELQACYAKVGIVSGEEVGGLIGLSVASSVDYSYAIPYLNSYDGYKYVGGLMGSVYGLSYTTTIDRNEVVSDYVQLLKVKKVKDGTNSDIQYTFSTLIVDNNNFKTSNTAELDYVSANYKDIKRPYITSNNSINLVSVYAGVVDYISESEEAEATQNRVKISNNTEATSKSSVMKLFKLYNVGDPDQTISFQEVFAGWYMIEYWSLDETKYFPLLIDKGVNNFIDIDSPEDLRQIDNNPDGNYRVIKPIDIGAETNWILRNEFTGILIGDMEDESKRATITITHLQPDLDGETSGFFKSTRDATISNLEFVWEKPIDISNVDKLSTVSGLTCQDNGSLISNVQVRAVDSDAGYIVKNEEDPATSGDEEITPIAGFGGVVGTATDTNVLNCLFVGKVTATLESTGSIHFGGIVGEAIGSNEKKKDEITGDEVEENVGTAVINSSTVGATARNPEMDTVEYPTTSFDLTIGEDNTSAVYIGGIVGEATYSAIASNNLGGTSNAQDYKYIDFNLNLVNVENYVYVGGIVGYAEMGLISNDTALTNINIIGKTNNTSSQVNVGGLAGLYDLPAQSLTTGISSCAVDANIKTVNGTDYLQTTTANSVFISTGVAELSGVATMKQCLFSGEINTEGSDIANLYVAGAVANAVGKADIYEIITNTVIYGGTTGETVTATASAGAELSVNPGTSKLYAGGLVAHAQEISISYSASWGRIIPITNADADEIYVGGIAGHAEEISVNNSYTISSIIADSIASEAIQHLNIHAVIGFSEKEKTQVNNVFYSSDYSLFADSVGSNYSGTTIANNAVWHTDLKTEGGSTNDIWTTLTSVTASKIPYLTSLEDRIYSFSIITKPSGASELNYVEGSAMRPVQVSTDSPTDVSLDYKQEIEGAFVSTYRYYLIVENNGISSLPTFSTALNGILMGVDITYTVDSVSTAAVEDKKENTNQEYSAIVPGLLPHSAISNLHVDITDKVITTNGLIAGLNQGVIFNSSVQGSNITLTGGDVGLITQVNTGLVSHCFSSAEIIKTSGAVGGIVATNKAKLLSNYFTGYINNSASAGILLDTTDNNFMYNNYMGGVIVGSFGKNFVAKTTTQVKGAKNFIDTYSDLGFTEIENSGVESVSTAELMSSSSGLTGEWYFTTTNGVIDTTSTTFGYNYNYPIHKLNKLNALSTSDTQTIDKTYHLYTGTGLMSDETKYKLLEEANKTKSKPANTYADLSIDEQLSVRYSALLGNIDVNIYNDALKISHMGILTSVQSLISEDRNYVLIYDIDGIQGAGDDATASPWKAVGTKGEGVNDFSNKTGTVDETVTNSFGFNGVFITNKYLKQDTDTDSACLIQNLDTQGLFTNISNAYFGNIKFGSYTGLVESGALGCAVTGDKVYVNNVSFVKDSVITGSASENNYYSALFGTIGAEDGSGSKASVMVEAFKSAENADSTPNLKLSSTTANVGLLVGKLAGELTLKNSDSTAVYMAWFDGNNYAGGLVGEMAGGTLTANSNVVSICESDLPDDVSNPNTTKVLGGVVGLSSTNNNSISNAKVRYLDGDSDGEIKIYSESFGGLVGIVEQFINFTDSAIIEIAGSKLAFSYKDDDFNNKFYGLIAGNQQADITLSSFTIESSSKGTEVLPITISSSTNSYNYNADAKCGVGSFVGYQNGELKVGTYTAPIIQLNAKGVPNVGGVSGYFAGGSVEVKLADDVNIAKPAFIVVGSTNVGGLFGYCISLPKVYNTGTNLLNAGKGYSIVVVDGSSSDSNKHQNFGGLFGKWAIAGASTGSGGASIMAEPKETTINNYNQVMIGVVNGSYEWSATEIKCTSSGYNGSAFNIGGIAGAVSGQPENVKLINSGSITSLKNLVETKNHILSAPTSSVAQSCWAQNVGGVFGLAEGINLTNISSTGSIYGYQNVGGLVGYMTNSTITNTYKFANNTDTNFTFKKDDKTVNLSSDESNIAVSGEKIVGVLNVGGAVGCLDNKSAITNVYVKTNVYGNANVGGLVGLSMADSTMTNNYVHGETKNDKSTGIVKGLYYKHAYTEDGKIKYATYIPTSIGGLAGFVQNSLAKNNVVQGVQITSAQEGTAIDETNGTTFENEVISTIENYIKTSSSAIGNNPSNAEELINNKDKIVKYEDIKTGYGGMYGTVNHLSLANYNFLVDIDINASLGINVGTYYGVVGMQEGSGGNGWFKAPELYTTNTESPVIKVDGAYNVGGIIGFVNSGSGATYSLNSSQAKGSGTDSVTVELQSRVTGMYVGGMIGKTNANQINNINLETSGTVKFNITAHHSYYIGGVVGRAEVTADSTLNLNNNISSGLVEGSDVKNFGGLIGMLKIGGSNAVSVSVTGVHEYAFTVNTVENSHYIDGDSEFNAEDKGSEIKLFAEAYYVNLDNISIVGTNEPSWYSSIANNPLNSKAKGWAREYTGFKQLQRNIPYTKNNGAAWDSIAVLYDAEKITHVGTIANLGLTGVELLWTDGETKTDLSGDYICFTIYEQEAGAPTLYSRMGIASLYIDTDESNNIIYTPYDEKANFGDWWNGFWAHETPAQVFYIDARNANNKLQGLTYFQWSNPTKNGDWKPYKTIGKKKNDGTRGNPSDTTFQMNTINKGGDDAHNQVKYISYFVDGYLYTDIAQHNSVNGAYFVFDLVYQNDSTAELIGDETTDWDVNTLPDSGSIFQVTGLYTPALAGVQGNKNAGDVFGTWSKVIIFVVEVIITVATMGAAAYAKFGATGLRLMASSAASKITSVLTKTGIKSAFKWLGGKITSILASKWGAAFVAALLASSLSMLASQFQTETAMQAKSYFVEPSDYNYGFFSTTYNRDIRYIKDKSGKISLVSESDYITALSQAQYHAYSSVRPIDYHTNEYIAYEITGRWIGAAKNGGTYKMDGMAAIPDDFTKLSGSDKEDLIEKLCAEGYEIFDSCSSSDFYQVFDNVNLLADGGTSEGVKLALKNETDKTVWVLSKKYELINGQYYINGYAATWDSYRVTLGFIPEKLSSGEDATTPNYIEKDGDTYVHGSWSEAGGYVYDNGYQFNNLEYTGGKYYINGTEVTDTSKIAQQPDEAMKYTVVPDSILRDSVKEEGYDFFLKAYYTAKGVSSLKAPDGTSLVKYATFGDPSTTRPSGTENIHYVRRTVSYNKLNADGSQAKDEYGNNIVQTQTVYFTLKKNQEFQDDGSATTLGTYSAKSGADLINKLPSITVAVYPSQFTNPYSGYSITNCSDEGKGYYYGHEAGATNYISHKPTYFLFEGGYATDGETSLVYVPVSESEIRYKAQEGDACPSYMCEHVIKESDGKGGEINVTYFYFKYGDGDKAVCYWDIINDYSNQTGKTPNSDSEETIGDIFIVKEVGEQKHLYKSDMNYMLSEDGYLNRIYSDFNMQNDEIHKNMYLTNSNVGLYTRYKYTNTNNGTFVAGENSYVWGKYNIVPKAGTTLLPSNNRPVILVESARVILNSGGKSIFTTGSSDADNAGSITIS